MKDTLASLIRHATPALLALGGLLASRDFIAPSDVASVNALVVIVVATAAKLTRPEAGGPLAVMGWTVVGALAGGMGCLPACSPAQL